jgi:hypothetical protein
MYFHLKQFCILKNRPTSESQYAYLCHYVITKIPWHFSDELYKTKTEIIISKSIFVKVLFYFQCNNLG